MDPNIAVRWIVPTLKGAIDAERIGILDITGAALGNVVGLGIADTCSKRVVDKMSRKNTCPISVRIRCILIPQKTVPAIIKMTPAKETSG